MPKHVTAADLALNVLDYGVKGDGVTDDTAAIQAAVNARLTGGNISFPPNRTYKINGTINLSAVTGRLGIHIPESAKLVQYANASVFLAQGTLGAGTNVSGNTSAGNRTAAVVDATPFAVGQWVYHASQNTVPGSSDKIAYLRRIKSISGTTLTLDKTFPRSLLTASSAHFRVATLLPPITIKGGGQVRHIDSTNTETLLNFILCERPIIELELGPSGDSGVTFSHCVGGGYHGYVHDLRDDGVGFGYGVDMRGASRDMRITGLGARCRHAFTTNAGPNITNSAFYGEPENTYVDMEIQDCSNKGLDTHRVGWGTTFIVRGSGGTSGTVQVRADNTIIIGGSASGSNSVGISIASEVQIPALISNVSITDVAGANSVGLYLAGPAIVNNAYIRRFSGKGVDVIAPGCILNNVVVDGVAAGSLIGIDLQSNDNLVTGGRVSNVATGVKVAVGATGNAYSTMTFGAGVTNQVVTT